MAKKSGASAQKRKKASGKSANKKKSQDVAVGGEVHTVKKKKGEPFAPHTLDIRFDCPESVHGIKPSTEDCDIGHVKYAQRISAKVDEDTWAAAEFEIQMPCARGHVRKSFEWVKKAVGDTIDEEYERVLGEGEAEEGGEDEEDFE
jgi:hypothetical protein